MRISIYCVLQEAWISLCMKEIKKKMGIVFPKLRCSKVQSFWVKSYTALKSCFHAVEPTRQLGMWIFLFKKELLVLLHVCGCWSSPLYLHYVFSGPSEDRRENRNPLELLLWTVVSHSVGVWIFFLSAWQKLESSEKREPAFIRTVGCFLNLWLTEEDSTHCGQCHP